jgi:predicted nucleic acid-binding protein
MKIYADTSALIAWFHPADEFARVVTDWRRE